MLKICNARNVQGAVEMAEGFKEFFAAGRAELNAAQSSNRARSPLAYSWLLPQSGFPQVSVPRQTFAGRVEDSSIALWRPA
jgi:hypothetical protein